MRPPDFPEQDAAGGTGLSRTEFSPSVLNDLFAFSPDAIFVTDPAGFIRGANPRASELFGYEQAELVGMSIEALVPERVRRNHPSHRENYNAHPRARQMGAALNLFGLRRDGTEFPVDIMLKPRQAASGPIVLSFVRDATEQRAVQDELRRQDQQIRSIVESVHDYAIYMLDADGYVITWNAGGERIKGYTADEILGKHFSRFFIQEDIERGHPAQLMQLATARGRFEEEGWRVRKDGSRFWANSVLTAIRDSAGTVTGYAKVTRDFTDRKRAEEAVMLQLSNALLANLDVGKLLTAISASIHEVIPHDTSALALYDPANGDMVVQFMGPYDADVFPGDARVPIEGTVAGRVFRTGEPFLMEQLSDIEFAPDTVRSLSRLGMNSGCWVPLSHHGKAIGTLGILGRLEGSIGKQEVEILARIAVQVAIAVDNAMAFRRIAELRDQLRQEKQYLESEINLDNRYEDIVGESKGLRQVLLEIETVAPTDATVLIQGETGTGKELLARAIHRLSQRSEHTFVKLNCAAIPAGLIESELFGHEKGAFTGAIARKMGRLELAHEGTLFLDEIGELPP